MTSTTKRPRRIAVMPFHTEPQRVEPCGTCGANATWWHFADVQWPRDEYRCVLHVSELNASAGI